MLSSVPFSNLGSSGNFIGFEVFISALESNHFVTTPVITVVEEIFIHLRSFKAALLHLMFA